VASRDIDVASRGITWHVLRESPKESGTCQMAPTEKNLSWKKYQCKIGSGSLCNIEAANKYTDILDDIV
jgi:hypothetical protein